VDVQDRLEWHGQADGGQLVPGHAVGLLGRLARPFWGLAGVWAVLCGAWASGQLHWQGDSLLTLALVLLLSQVAWGSLWDLVAGCDWFGPLASGWSTARPIAWRGLPYTQPRSPAGRLVRGLGHLVGWWRQVFWPEVGPALLGLAAAAGLTVVLALLLPPRLRLLQAALVALLGLGLVQKRRGREALAGQAVVQVGLGWLAGHLAFAEPGPVSLALALAFSATALGALQIQAGRRRGVALLNGGHLAVAALLVGLEQPLAAGAVGFLALVAMALQPSLAAGAPPAQIARRSWPWTLGAMLVAALAVA
jgi:hypothetical protein